MPDSLLLVTGATGMVGRHVVERALAAGYRVRGLARDTSDKSGFDPRIEWHAGDLERPETLPPALEGVELVVHTAAKVGDWGPLDEYRKTNVVALEHLVTAARHAGKLRRWVQISSLGVYAARDHFGTDETEPIDLAGLDGYTRSKAEAEELLARHMADGLPATILRPGFIYGRGDRHVLPRLVERIQSGRMKLFGDGAKLMNNTYVDNLVDAIFLALDSPAAVGETFNIRDGRLVTKAEFVGEIVSYLGAKPVGKIPLGLARVLASVFEGVARAVGSRRAPLVNKARYKFLGLNLDFSIAKAERVLGYRPAVGFREGMRTALAAMRTAGVDTSAGSRQTSKS
jgi:nucleoside-diphosphate-sugar epimerase